MLYIPVPRKLKEGIHNFCRRWPRVSRFIGLVERRHKPIRAILTLVLHTAGLVLSFSALRESRTPQGSVAWLLSLNTVPAIAVPAYLVFGETEFEDFVATRGQGKKDFRPTAEKWLENLRAVEPSGTESSRLLTTLSRIGSLPVTTGNEVDLLVDGTDTFDSIFQAIDRAEKYIFIQFYIIRNDETGGSLKDKLVAKAKEGVRVHVLYDDYGSIDLKNDFHEELEEAGVYISPFMRPDEKPSRFRLNYRNHRKLVIVDGITAFVGGHNVGDEYLGKHPVYTPWRDSHLRLKGPVVTTLQVSFLEDWLWATSDVIEDLNWDLERADDLAEGQVEAVAVPTGPADETETCNLMFHAIINSASDRLWMATPYFVPDHGLVVALQLAAKRGVDVKIVIPGMTDSKLTERSAYSYLDEMDLEGIQFMRYDGGFLHQKVFLVDDEFVSIGSANFDNRSVRLNFELMVGVRDKQLNSDVAKMLEKDFANSSAFKPKHFREKGFFYRTSVRASRLLAPIQ